MTVGMWRIYIGKQFQDSLQYLTFYDINTIRFGFFLNVREFKLIWNDFVMTQRQLNGISEKKFKILPSSPEEWTESSEEKLKQENVTANDPYL